MAMGVYLTRVLVQTGVVAADSQPFAITVVAIAGVTLVSIVHLFDVKIVSRFQVAFTTLKVSLILMLIVAGFALAAPQPVSFAPTRAAARLRPHPRVRRLARLRDVRLLGMERRDLRRERRQAARTVPAALAHLRHAPRHPALRAAQRRVPVRGPGQRVEGAARRRLHRREPHLRRHGRADHGAADLDRPRLRDQLDGVGRPARHAGDGRGRPAPARALGEERQRRPSRLAGLPVPAGRRPRSSRRRSTPSSTTSGSSCRCRPS